MPADRATSDTDTSGSNDAATRCSFSSRDHRRRLSTDVITSTCGIVIVLLLGLPLGLPTFALSLQGGSHRRDTQGLAQRAEIVLLAAAGLENKAIAQRVGAVENTVGKWRRPFAQDRLDGLYDEPRPGRPREIGDDAIGETIRLTLEATPGSATDWSLR